MISSDFLNLKNIRKVPLPSEDNFPYLFEVPHKYKRFFNWVLNNNREISNNIIKYGAVVFRGCEVLTPVLLENILKNIGFDLNRQYGDLPKLSSKTEYIFDATPYPSNLAILFHNEASHTPFWPNYQWFYCAKPSITGGETPILNCANLIKMIPKRTIKHFRDKKILYIRNFIDGLDVSWKKYFGVKNENQLMKLCKKNHINIKLMPDNTLRTYTSLPGVINHPHTKQTIFFNQILLHHITCTDVRTRSALLDLYGYEGLPRNVMFDDFTYINDDLVAVIIKSSCDLAVSFDWKEGDLMMIDNLKVSHARRPYIGERSVLVSMTKPIYYELLMNQ